MRYADKSGIIHLEGAVKQTSNSGADANLIGTLPGAAADGERVHHRAHVQRHLR